MAVFLLGYIVGAIFGFVGYEVMEHHFKVKREMAIYKG